jgi:peptidoglycan/xylan/chitin deacetylase (PgdA/CDA1 family)
MRAILTYHSLDRSGSAISVAPESFARQMHWLASQSVAVVSLDELLALPPSVRACAITFDDALQNVADHALPIFAAYGWTATVFVPTARVGRDNLWKAQGRHPVPALPLMPWDTLGRLAESGWSIESHTRSHPSLPSLSDTCLDDELGGAQADIIAELGITPRWLAYPFGDYDARVSARCAKWYTGACTTVLRPLAPADAPFALPRLDAWYLGLAMRHWNWGSPAWRGYFAVRRLMRRVREVLG